MQKIHIWKTATIIYLCSFYTMVCASPTPDSVQRAEMVSKLSRVQVPFVENRGQIQNGAVSFYAKTLSGTLFVDDHGVLTYALLLNDKNGVVFKEMLTEKKIKPLGLAPSPTLIHYFKGMDRSTWKTNIPSYETISLGEIYNNINLTLRAYENNVEKIFTVFPGGNPESIKIKLKGIKRLMANANGELDVLTELGSTRFTKPLAYQITDGEKQFVEVAYVISKGSGYGFKVGRYDKKRPLIIDPLLASTIIGASAFDFSWTIAIDDNNNVFVSSNTKSHDFPTTLGAYDETYNGGDMDIYVAKFDSTLSTLLASTFIGGSDGDTTYKLTLDSDGNVFFTGFTQSSDFPITPGAYSTPSRGNKDAFVSLLDNSLSNLLASTVIGGSNNDNGYYIILDESENVIITGFTESSDYPHTTGAYDEGFNGGQDVFISKFDNLLSSLLASTFIGGDETDSATGLTLDGDGNIVITGAASANFPTTSGAYDRTHNGGTDAFVAKMDSTLSTLLASTYIGGSSDGYGYSVKVNESGEVYMAGETFSSDYPTTPGAYDRTWNGGFMDVMISKFDSTLSTLLASTYLGGSKQDWHHHALLIDGEGNIYINGLTQSTNFPTTANAEKVSNTYEWDIYISKFNSNLSTLLYSTYFGGNTNGDGSLEMAFDSAGYIYITGWTKCTDFPTTPGAYDESYNGDMDVYVAKLCLYGTPNNVDCDSIPDGEDNCPDHYNPGQEDTYPPQGNGIGDACDCEANFDCDQSVDAGEVMTFLQHFGRSQYNRPCSNQDPCLGDFTCDKDVDAQDVTKFLEDFGRSQYNKPCPICTQGQPWCVYP